MNIEEKIEQTNKERFNQYPNEINIEYWSGCNYYINQGNVESEPLGTATSMHDCDGCDMLGSCNLKKDHPIWKYDKEAQKHIEKEWDSIRRSLR